MRVDKFNFPPPGKRVDCLLGCVDFFNILISHQKISKNVFLLQTRLGSTLAGINSGKLIREEILDQVENNLVTTDQLDSLVKRYWTFEKLPGDSNSELSADDYFALKHLEANTSYDPKEKHFTVRHIFRETPDMLNNSRQAMGQFLSLEKKLSRPDMNNDCKLYIDHFLDGIQKGIF